MRIFQLCCPCFYSKIEPEPEIEIAPVPEPVVELKPLEVHRQLADGSTFKGTFVGKVGKGTRIFSNGDRWKGNFLDFVLHGDGEMSLKNGNRELKGRFERGFLVEGTDIDLTGKHGVAKKGTFANGNLSRGKMYNEDGELLMELS